eukprot:TRINITY_DN32706_c0_g1_i1.p2 TRINITY_DN32706_c0_g1~~TRINITY_DN32706_c0_g1_i1.p2  ORF type:complete len:297 (+),score=151.83 TRINITY_DN32706_c0_g1_i1:56-946(+)
MTMQWAKRAARQVGWAPRTAFSGQQKRNTTILCVRKEGKVVLMGDRQVTQGERYVAKSSTKKLRRAGDSVLVGFAGSTADAMTLLEKLEAKLTEYPGQLLRACVELAKEWRGDKSMRQLNASMIVANDTESLEIDGVGNVITPEEDGVLAIGSGGMFAKAAARALVDVDGMCAEQVCRKAIGIATEIDVFSNSTYNIDMLEKTAEDERKEEEAKRKQEAEDALKVEPKIEKKPADDDDGKAGGAAAGGGEAASGATAASGGGKAAKGSSKGTTAAAAEISDLQARITELEHKLAAC